MKQQNIIIVTGCSGSGKSTALAAFEDAGFFCIDNMPVKLVPHFLNQPAQKKTDFAGWAFVMDLRDQNLITQFASVFNPLKQNNYQIKIVFIDADEQILLRRYNQTRRHHPLAQGGSLLEAIRAEKQQIHPLRKVAHHIIDTSHFSVHELKFAILNIAQQNTAISGMTINVVSFGFKYGLPSNADIIMDVRFLINPFFIPELKQKDGETPEVREYILNDSVTNEFLNKYLNLLDYLIPLYENEGKAYLTIAIGCTGGRHRSVVIAQHIYNHIQHRQSAVRLIHRDIGYS